MGRILGFLKNIFLIILGVMFMLVVRRFIENVDFSSAEGEWISLAFLVGMAALVLISYFGNIAAANAVTHRIPTDISSENRIPTRNASQLIQQMQSLGFQRIGETSVDVNGKEGVTWFLANSSNGVIAEVVDVGVAMCQFSTVFQDSAVLETSFPKGEHINKENYYSRKNSRNMQTAYQQHLADSSTLAGTHGIPSIITDMKSLIAWDLRYRELYGKYKIGKHAQSQLFVGFFAVILLSFSVFVLYIR